MGDVSSRTRDSWQGEISLRAERRNYFSGEVFNETPLDTGVEDEETELYPVGVNLVKMLCIAQADSFGGEWDKQILSFEPDTDDSVTKSEESASTIANNILRASEIDTMMWELELDRNIYGGAPYMIRPNIKSFGRILWKRVALDTFFPIWDPEDIDELLEVYIVTAMTKEQAKQKYGYDGDKVDPIYRVDHYTRSYYDSKLEGKRIDSMSGKNPWGFVPFEYMPRMRTTHWWGDSLTEDIIRVQDELNLRLADLGVAINYNAQPIRWGMNLPKTFNTGNYPVGPNILWDLGRAFRDAPEPSVGVLESMNPIPEGTFKYIKFLYDWGRTSVSAPPIVFGEDEGGAQRSGVTLEIRMWPLIKALRRSRAYMSKSLKRGMKKSALMLQQKKLLSQYALQRLIDRQVDIVYAQIMPRDQAKIVDEVTKRLSTVPPSISLITATRKLGDGVNEDQNIRDMLNDDEYYQRQQQAQEPTGADSSTGVDDE